MRFLPKLAALVALVAVALAVMSGTGYKLEWWLVPVAFKVLTGALIAGGAAAALGLISLFVTQQKVLSLGALLVGGVVGGFILMQVMTARGVPMMHDITTDLENPPEFVEVVALRTGSGNSIDYATKMVPRGGDSEEMVPYPEMQAEFYTDIKPLTLPLGTGPCFDLAAETAQGQGWEMVSTDKDAGLIEATDTTFFFGFKDDVVIRITGDSTSCRVDMRSSSRVGMSDVGVNAKRIGAYLAALEAAAA